MYRFNCAYIATSNTRETFVSLRTRIGIDSNARKQRKGERGACAHDRHPAFQLPFRYAIAQLFFFF